VYADSALLFKWQVKMKDKKKNWSSKDPVQGLKHCRKVLSK
jgi:hypothetical protein